MEPQKVLARTVQRFIRRMIAQATGRAEVPISGALSIYIL
jgi:hypothetical protein